MLPGVVPGRIMVEAWAYIVTGAALAAATRSPSWRGPLRDWCVAAFRIVSAVFGQRTVAAGRLLPLPVESWTQFLLVSMEWLVDGLIFFFVLACAMIG